MKVKNKELGYFLSLFSFTVDLGKEVWCDVTCHMSQSCDTKKIIKDFRISYCQDHKKWT